MNRNRLEKLIHSLVDDLDRGYTVAVGVKLPISDAVANQTANLIRDTLDMLDAVS